MATNRGTIKKTEFAQFSNLRANGLIAIKLDAGDKLESVLPTTGNDYILLITKQGKAIKFNEANVRAMGRATTGVRGINLEKSDELISMLVFPQNEEKGKHVLTISEKGLGKRTGVDSYPLQKRGGKGLKAAIVSPKTGNLAAAIMVTQQMDQVVMTSRNGQVIKLPLRNIPLLGRATQGVILMRFAKSGDQVAAVTTLEKGSDEEENG
jgi:DNA gyrase subunit A